MPMKPVTRTGVLIVSLTLASCAGSASRSGEGPPPAMVIAPDAGTVRWWMPESADDLGKGALFKLKVDRVSVPSANMMVATQTTDASGIPVHLHVAEEEILYILKGNGFAIVGKDRQEVPVEAGSLVYIPIGRWHGLRNADPNDRMDVLVVSTPVTDNNLGDFFRNVGTKPGHPPLNVSEEEFRQLFRQYGMKLPEE